MAVSDDDERLKIGAALATSQKQRATISKQASSVARQQRHIGWRTSESKRESQCVCVCAETAAKAEAATKAISIDSHKTRRVKENERIDSEGKRELLSMFVCLQQFIAWVLILDTRHRC